MIRRAHQCRGRRGYANPTRRPPCGSLLALTRATTRAQVRGKLFIFHAPDSGKSRADGEVSPAAESASSAVPKEGAAGGGGGSGGAGKEAQPGWVVMGIGNLRLNVPKEGCSDGAQRPRILMRRQKTFQASLSLPPSPLSLSLSLPRSQSIIPTLNTFDPCCTRVLSSLRPSLSCAFLWLYVWLVRDLFFWL
jgi:hypothetical protein